MGMTINTNMSALTAYRNLSTTQNDMSKSLEKLSSGLRINRAADDAAGLGISEGLKSQVGGLAVAARNAQDGINVAQTAEGSLGQTQAILQRMRDLAVQAGNDSNNADSRAAISQEAGKLTSELGRIASSTNFNGISLLNGKAGTNSDGLLTFQVGANAGANNQITVDLSKANVSDIAKTLGGGTDFTLAGATTGMVFTGVAADGTTATTVTTGTLSIAAGATADAAATALNGDATFSAKLTASVVDGQLHVKPLNGGTVASITATGGTVSNVKDNGAGVSFTDATAAQKAISAIDTQITGVSTARASLGADQNRLEYTITNLNISKENLTASRSQITDTDMASEMVNFTRDSILSQAGTAMLAQANQSNSGVLKLLG